MSTYILIDEALECLAHAASEPGAQVVVQRMITRMLTIGESPAINPDPAKRSEKTDPETLLKRRKPPISRAERVGSGWITIPEALSLDKAHAVRIFEAVGAWRQVKFDSCAA